MLPLTDNPEDLARFSFVLPSDDLEILKTKAHKHEMTMSQYLRFKIKEND